MAETSRQTPRQTPRQARETRGTRETPRRDASMMLLTTLGEDSLDAGYARAAARRQRGTPPARHGRLILVAGLVAIGLLLTTAAAQARDRAPATAQARSQLVTEIEDRTAANERLESTLATERTAVSDARRDGLRITAEGSRLAGALATLESSTGAGAVTGRGMSVSLTQVSAEDIGTDGDPRTSDATEGRVSDRDLQTVVNEVWAAGAEAVAINEQRLTALSAIRSAGEAILVDFRPLNPPYEVQAVGPPSMRTAFVGGFGGSYLQVLRDYGIDFTIEDRREVVLPASAGLRLRYATAPRDVRSAATPDPRDRTSPQ